MAWNSCHSRCSCGCRTARPESPRSRSTNWAGSSRRVRGGSRCACLENPYVIVDATGIEVIAAGISDGRIRLPVEELRTTLIRLPIRAWPYGRVVAAQGPSIGQVSLGLAAVLPWVYALLGLRGWCRALATGRSAASAVSLLEREGWSRIDEVAHDGETLHVFKHAVPGPT